MKAFYGSRLSPNMTRTPEGFLICLNVPIGRVGWMDYLGEEVPQGPPGKIVKVYRSPEELFSKATMASFEGKSVTNNHPVQMIDINTVTCLERGHVTNVRQDGDFLMADLVVKDQGLIEEIDSGKREVSCGYECAWVPLNDEHTKYEQKDIIGNHVAVVAHGRAGPRAAIQDSKPKTGGKVMKNKKAILARMFKAFAKDAEPEELEEAMDAFGEEGETQEQQKKEDVGLEQVMAAIGKVGEAVKGLADRVTKLEQSDKEVHKEIGADEEFANFEKEDTKDADPEGEKSETVEPEGEEKEKDPAADSFEKFYQGMKKTIMAIPDKATRDKAAKEFISAVKDARPYTGKNSYSGIMDVMRGHKQQAMDQNQHKTASVEELNQKAVDAWTKAREAYK